MNLDDRTFDREFAALLFEQPRAVHQLALVDLAFAARRVEQRERRQRIGAFACARPAAFQARASGSGGATGGGGRWMVADGVGRDDAAFSAAAAASTIAAVREGFFGALGRSVLSPPRAGSATAATRSVRPGSRPRSSACAGSVSLRLVEMLLQDFLSLLVAAPLLAPRSVGAEAARRSIAEDLADRAK